MNLPHPADTDGEAERLFAEAVRLFEEHDDADACILFLRVIELPGPREATARKYLQQIAARADELPFAQALHLLEAGQHAAARKRFEHAAELDGPRRAEAETLLHQLSPPAEKKPEFPPFSGLEDFGVGSVDPTPERAAPIRRIPHLRPSTDLPLWPGEALTLSVYADTTEVHDGERAEALELDAKAATVDVRLLVSAHLLIDGQSVAAIRLDAAHDSSSTATFQVRVRSATELATAKLVGTPAEAVALFSHKGRPSGKVSRMLPTALAPGGPRPIRSTAATAPPHATPRSGLQVDPEAKSADLTVTVVAAKVNDGRQFWCTVQTPHITKYAGGVSEEWNLPASTLDIVTNYMENFTAKGASALERIAALKGAGKQLFDATPDVFKNAFWELIDGGHPLRSIAIVSEEPHIPWELMIPRRTLVGGFRDTRRALGVDFVIGRWTRKDIRPAHQTIPLTDSYVIAPRYSSSRALPHARAEAAYVVNKFQPGTSIEPADFDTIVLAFKGGGRSLVHFACHGSVSPTGRQAIDLENNRTVAAEVLLGDGALEAAIQEKQPLVFLNACEVGRATPALSGVGGFAESFIDLGASAVIAPLWSVKDDIAHKIALEFYDETCNKPQARFAEILSHIRARAYDPAVGEDTYAAYCYYGDPLASRTRPA